MRPARGLLVGWVLGRLAKLRFPVLFAISAALFALNLVVPDAIPFADELLLGLGTLLLGSLRRREPAPDPARDVAAPRR